MTTLKDRLIAMIRASGPIPVATYMDLCLHDRRHGYYATRPGLGDDFITAPESSQVFGELIGLWAAHEWHVIGAPQRFSLVEIGPGRGTLMDDALRATRNVAGFHAAMDLHFIEPSPVLSADLAERFASEKARFVADLSAIPVDQPFILIANEWLDCLPVQQMVRAGDAWHERVIGLSDADDLVFGLNPDPFPPEISPDQTADAIEIQPGLKTLTQTLRALFDQTRGRALLVDYGSAQGTPDDTLRSYQHGHQIDPLAAPGDSDLTCDVDFARLHRLAAGQDLRVDGPVSQSQFLLTLGAEARLNQLAKQHPERADELYAGVRKLVDPAEMGTRFQVLAISHPDLPVATGL